MCNLKTMEINGIALNVISGEVETKSLLQKGKNSLEKKSLSSARITARNAVSILLLFSFSVI